MAQRMARLLAIIAAVLLPLPILIGRPFDLGDQRWSGELAFFGLLASAFSLVSIVLSLVVRRWGITLLAGVVLVAGAATAAVQMPASAHCRSCEAGAIGSLRSINSGQASYSRTCASGGYAIDLADLAKVPAGASQGFISVDLAVNGVSKNRYTFSLAKNLAAGVTDISPEGACNGAVHTSASSYFASAAPQAGSGLRYFATDTSGTIFVSDVPIPNPIPSTVGPLQ